MEGGSLVIGTEGRLVHIPQEMTGAVEMACNANGYGSCWIGCRWEWEKWNGFGKRVLYIISVMHQLEIY